MYKKYILYIKKNYFFKLNNLEFIFIYLIGDFMKKIVLLLILLIPLNVLALNDNSKGSIVMDIDSGRILYQKNSNSRMLIASITKIMTFLTSLELASDKLDSKVIVGDEVLKMYGTNMYLTLKEELTLRDLLYGLMLRSGNDASVVIATYTANNISNFVYFMNEIATNIGMQNTLFKNPHGLDEETKNYSTAYDLAILTRYLYLKYPLYKEIAGSKYYNFKSNLKSYSLTNRSQIIFEYKNITTAKTGYTPSAGKSLVTTATKDNLNLLIVTLDNSNHYEDQKNMYEYFFKNYKNYLLIDKDNFKISNQIIPEKYYLKNSFSYPLTVNEYKNIEKKVIVGNKQTNILGTIQIILNDKIIHEEPIYKKEEKVLKENFFAKIKKFFKNLFS